MLDTSLLFGAALRYCKWRCIVYRSHVVNLWPWLHPVLRLVDNAASVTCHHDSGFYTVTKLCCLEKRHKGCYAAVL